MLFKAYAKINISLDVVGKRDDGYHMLEMIMQRIELYDILDIVKNNSGINIKCNKNYVPLDERNLVYKAAKLFIDKYNINGGIDFNIIKNIPVAAGLAGGSADAATTLIAMRQLYNVDVSDDELCNLGLKIGADVPYCIKGGTALCEGIGEKVTQLKSFHGNILVLIKPNFGVSTKEVYKNLDINKIYKHPDTKGLINAIENNDLKYISENMRNVLENVTLKKHIILKEIKQKMVKDGALGAMMSGSGPSVFGLFDDMLKAQRCYEHFKNKYNEVYITRTI
ncbi:4-(cytidine 5'-diphospho)-2-C-methyl-D-erythritol kinase [Clostridium botulinum]|uniref:4-diphosphocytidyl-2-C-methyl-D-erythritol kinase n=1 Tax=Clostridium botulinum C/D str. DC5 TaxID=1443128 RepID=A0A0A0IFU9_CLOBO|nr:4-(cytidine 5'-diphospho)-2-C-methyl-D-erythritol kinase [Clostridium botulinum]KEI00336.1 4-diphosphocytidyl-2C-methyl-D-erythritol kinase [Clostridium botulinum C/D str. BKT75002]KEI08957.1 4-diphosphocytidyl-2C-methyl-D-erythritol kinase [Clostridium botulinum C/D str. BKT2873]KGM93869.1 4-diphosphocytidyl-2C-methyl-D-erythritol kinase [Clostridium botulinum D str. CCUG 7971]KGM99428.1 4-diphosphocytidyl-2C-methyl-D-erythritol kinase [Clostridium botulinum C/D str. DC5]KOC51209.1 4-dipho